MTWQHSDAASRPDPIESPLRPPRSSGFQGEDTPAGLLQRADFLLDEMMMAGVDFAGGAPAPANVASAQPPSTALVNGGVHGGAIETGSRPGGSPPPAPPPGAAMPGEALFDAHGAPITAATPPPRTERLISASDRYAAATGAVAAGASAGDCAAGRLACPAVLPRRLPVTPT